MQFFPSKHQYMSTRFHWITIYKTIIFIVITVRSQISHFLICCCFRYCLHYPASTPENVMFITYISNGRLMCSQWTIVTHLQRVTTDICRQTCCTAQALLLGDLWVHTRKSLNNSVWIHFNGSGTENKLMTPTLLWNFVIFGLFSPWLSPMSSSLYTTHMLLIY